MASLVNKGTTTLRARSTLPDAWMTCSTDSASEGVEPVGEEQTQPVNTDHPERSEQEVNQVHGAGILDQVLQFPLQTRAQTVTHAFVSLSTRTISEHPTSWLKACLNFCRQSTNSSSVGGLERSVRTPSGAEDSFKRSKWKLHSSLKEL